MPGFLEAYFELAAERFAPGAGARRAHAALVAAARGMFAARGGRTLECVFLEAFAPAVGRTTEEARATFADFHRDGIEPLRVFVRPAPGARRLVGTALALGLELVLATNPVFLLDAIRARVRWGGLADVPFSLVTAAELMHAAKPAVEYFREALSVAGLRPEECRMVGDNPGMDLPAADAGIATWLVVPPGGAPAGGTRADHAGTLDELAAWLAARAARG